MVVKLVGGLRKSDIWKGVHEGGRAFMCLYFSL